MLEIISKDLKIWPLVLRIFRNKSSPIVWKVVHSAHSIMFLLYFSIVAAILLTAGIFAVVIHAISQFQNRGYLYLDAIYIVGLIDILLCTLASIWLLSVQRLADIFQLEKYFNGER